MSRLIDGFQSPFGMELLATVDWLIQREACPDNVPALKEGLGRWKGGEKAGERKLRLFEDWMLDLAVARLREFPV